MSIVPDPTMSIVPVRRAMDPEKRPTKSGKIFHEQLIQLMEQGKVHVIDYGVEIDPSLLSNDEAAGDDSTQIMQEKPEAAGECPTENDKKPLSECVLCGKITDDHDFFNCPDRERIRKLTSYCMVCNKKTDHDTPDCPKATEDVLKNLAYCSICDKNTDHDTFDCPNENGFVWIDGVKIPNVCDLCRVVGHRGIDCPIDSDNDLEFGLDSSMDDW